MLTRFKDTIVSTLRSKDAFELGRKHERAAIRNMAETEINEMDSVECWNYTAKRILNAIDAMD